MNFQERIAWLGRMPRPYKFLLGSQAMIMMFLINRRQNMIQEHNKKFEQKTAEPNDVSFINNSEQHADQPTTFTAKQDVVVRPQGSKSPTDIYHEMMKRQKDGNADNRKD